MPQSQFASYERSADSPLIVGITHTGQRVGFEDMNQFTQSGGNPQQIQQVASLGSYIPYSQYNEIMTPTLAPPVPTPGAPAPVVTPPTNPVAAPAAPIATPSAYGAPAPAAPVIDPAVARNAAANDANAQAKALYDQIATNDVETRKSSQVVADALKKIQDNRTALTAAASGAFMATPEETAAKARLANIQNASRDLSLKTTAAGQALDSFKLPSDAIGGFKNELAKDVNFRFQTLGIQEQAALGAVKMYQDDRANKVQQAQFLLNENSAEFDRTLGIADEMNKIKSENMAQDASLRGEARQVTNDAYAKAKDQKQEMRQQLSDIMTYSQGKSWNELDGASQTAIKDSLQGTGITVGMIQNTLGAANRQWAQENGVTQPFYLSPDGRTVIDAKTGNAVNFEQYVKAGGKGDFTDVQKIDANTIQEKKDVEALRMKYFDAGITTGDSLKTATEKITAKSAIYREQVRPPKSAGGSGGGGKKNSGSDPVPPTVDSDKAVRNYLQDMNKSFGNDNNYYDVWGTAADALKEKGLDPNKYDKIFWDVFRPGEYAKNHQ